MLHEKLAKSYVTNLQLTLYNNLI